MPSRRILHARFVFPVTGEPIENGFVSVEDGCIVEVGSMEPRGDPVDLGNVALLPGLINAHTHLELSGIANPLGTPGTGFVEWIRRVVEWRGDRPNESAMTIAAGLRECAKEGVTALGNIAQTDDPQTAYENSHALGVRFFELIAPHRERIPAIIEFLNRFPARQAAATTSWYLGLSPHAPYSVHPDALRNIVAFSAGRKIPLAMHLAESREEMDLLREGIGPFREFLEERGSFEPASFPGGKRPLDYLRLLSAAQRVLIVHGNYLDDEEIEFLADHSTHMAIVYCPRTHVFFGHDPYPLEKLADAGVTVAFGTDSRASSPDLSLLAEMRMAAKLHPRIGRDRILRMATIDAADALGRSEEIGSIQPGKAANFAVVALPGGEGDEPYRLLFDSDGPVVQTWFRGRRS